MNELLYTLGAKPQSYSYVSSHFSEEYNQTNLSCILAPLSTNDIACGPPPPLRGPGLQFDCSFSLAHLLLFGDDGEQKKGRPHLKTRHRVVRWSAPDGNFVVYIIPRPRSCHIPLKPVCDWMDKLMARTPFCIAVVTLLTVITDLSCRGPILSHYGYLIFICSRYKHLSHSPTPSTTTHFGLTMW